MEDQAKSQPAGSGHDHTMAQPQQTSRPRWSPKPEQILILESIFNSGTVNPTKDETVKIQKLLGRYGPVADANVFYWFQNRRSRSRRRLRQIREAAAQEPSLSASGGSRNYDGGNNAKNTNNNNNNDIVIQYEDFLGGGFGPSTGSMGPISSLPAHGNESQGYGGGSNILHGDFSAGGWGLGLNPHDMNASSSSNGGHENFFFSLSGHTSARFQDNEQSVYPGLSDLSYEPEVITVFINGVATQVGRGPLNVKATFNGDFVMYHGTGVAVEMNEYGYIVHGLQHGEYYFLVPRDS